MIAGFIAGSNAPLRGDLYAMTTTRWARSCSVAASISNRSPHAVSRFGVAVPSWGVGTGGTRFARFPGPGEPRNVFEKLEDCGVINALCGATPTVSLHLPWDLTRMTLSVSRSWQPRQKLAFDAVNSNTFQDQRGQALSYKYGSLTSTDAAVRDQAVAHNLECIRIGERSAPKR